jgi:hypothetical protein
MMKTKSTTGLFCALLFTALFLPLVGLSFDFAPITNTWSDSFEPANNQLIWYDDCDSPTGWVENATNVENQVSYVHPGVSLLTDGSGLFSDTFPGYDAEAHGVQFFKKLDAPMRLENDLDFRVSIEHVGTPDRMGSVGVVLLDETNATILKAGGVDGWYSSTCNAWVSYRELAVQTTEYNTKSGAWSGTLRIWYDSATESLKGDAAGDEFTLRTSGNFDPSREAHMVGLVFYNKQFYSYESHLVNEIAITVSGGSTFSWHHDCSNVTAFDGDGDDSWLWEHSTPDLLTTSGTLNSSGQYINVTDLGTPPVDRCWFGPLQYHTLAAPFQFSQFRTFDVEFEVNPNGYAGATGGIFVTLHDESGKPIINVQVRDPFIATPEVMPGAAWQFANGTRLASHPGVLVSSPYIQTILIELNATGLYANLPAVGEGLILDWDALEERQVCHVSIWIAGSKEASSPPWPHTEIVRVHDIALTWISTTTTAPTTTTSSPTTSDSTTPTSPTTSPSLPPGNPWDGYLLPISIGSGVVIIIVVGVICMSRRGLSGTINPSQYDW